MPIKLSAGDDLREQFVSCACSVDDHQCWGRVKFEKGETQSSQSVRNSLRKSEQSKSDWSQFAAGAVDVKSAVMHSESAQVATCLNYHRFTHIMVKQHKS